VILIGFAVIIVQNQIILNNLTAENPIDKLMTLPEMQEFKGYQGSAEYLTLQQVEQLAQQYPDVYGNITQAIYRVQLTGEKNILVLYDYAQNKIIRTFEMLNAEMSE
jgi:hypothetical protein